MDAMTPRSWNFPEPGSPRRPSSRASSTGTEIPGAPRTLSREIEHIKNLVSRAQLSAKPLEGSITATIFRLSVARQENITQAQILQELDGLKRRIKAETRPVPRRQLDDDPETETESEAEDVVDERDEELDSIREELQLVREQREKWIEAAEERVDKLSDENEVLNKQLEDSRKELDNANESCAALKVEKKKHDTVIAELKSSHAKQFKQLNDTQLKNAQRERDSALRSLEDKDSYIESLEQDVKDLKNELEHEHTSSAQKLDAAEAAQNEIKERHANDLASLRETTEQSLTTAKEEADKQLKNLKDKHDRHCSHLSQAHDQLVLSIRNDHESALQNMHTEYDESAAKVKEEHITELQARSDEAKEQLQAAQASHEKVMRDKQEMHEQALQEKDSSYKTELQAQRDEHNGKLEEESRNHQQTVDNLKKEQQVQIEFLQSNSELVLAKLREEHDQAIQSLRAEHNSSIQQTEQDFQVKLDRQQQDHAQEAERLRADRETALKSSAEGAADQSQLVADLDKRHEEERTQWRAEQAGMEVKHKSKLQAAQEDHAAIISKLKSEHQIATERQEAALGESKAELERQLESLKQEHFEEMTRAAAVTEEKLKSAHEQHKSEIATKDEAHDTFRKAMEERIQFALDAADKKCDALKDTHITNLQELHTAHEEETSKLTEQHQQDTCRLKDIHIEALEEASRTNLHMLNELQFKHNEMMSELQGQLIQANDNVKALQLQHDTASQDQGNLHEEEISKLQEDLRRMQISATETAKASEERLKQEHAAQLQSVKDEFCASTTRAESDHQTTLGRALEEATRNAQLASEEALKALHNDLESATQKLKSQHNEELESTRNDHSRELLELRTELTSAREEIDRKQKDYASLSALHAAEVAKLFSDHQEALQKLKADRAESTISSFGDMLNKATTEEHAQHDDEGLKSQDHDHARLERSVEELQAEIIEHHQTRNQLEGLLQQKTHEAIQAVESSKHSDRKYAALDQEMKSLTTKHQRTEQSLQELQDTILEHQNLSSDENLRVQQELDALKTQIAAAQKEKAAVQSDIDSKSAERSEIARQNEFLTRQLSELGTHMNSNGHAKSKTTYSDRGMQTAPRIDVLGGSPKRSSHLRNVSLTSDLSPRVNGTPSGSKSQRNSLVFGPELNQSVLGSPLARSNSVDARPRTPTNPIVSAMAVRDSASKRRSLHEYVPESDRDVFERGSVATANEALLARKIREHVGETQKSRDALAKEYQDKFDALLKEKERLDKQVILEQAQDFVKERELIASRFLADETHAIIAGAKQPESLQSAEQRLVQKYNRRIAKRKSQIRLQHADDFHNLTQDYDRRLEDLLFSKGEFESDLGFGSLEINGDSDDTVRQSKPAENDGGSASKLPKKSLTGIPRSVTRTASFTKDDEKLQSTKPRVDRTPSNEAKGHPPVRQRSLMRLKSPTTEPLSRRASSIRDSPDTPLRPLASEHPDSDYAGDADEFHKHGRALKRQSGSPNFRISQESQRVPSNDLLERSLSSSSRRSKRHSSEAAYKDRV